MRAGGKEEMFWRSAVSPTPHRETIPGKEGVCGAGGGQVTLWVLLGPLAAWALWPSLWPGTLASAKGEGERPHVLRCGLRAGDGLHGGHEGRWYGHPATLQQSEQRRWDETRRTIHRMKPLRPAISAAHLLWEQDRPGRSALPEQVSTAEQLPLPGLPSSQSTTC